VTPPTRMSMSPAPQPLRVLLVISNLEYGGAQRQVIELANAADPARMEVHLCTLSPYVPLGAQLSNHEQRLHVIAKSFKFDISVVTRLMQLIRRLKIDVVQSYLFDAEIAVRLAGRAARVPLVVGSERNTDYRPKRRHLVAYWVTRRCVDVIIANSNAGAAFNSRILRNPLSMYRVVHNGVNTAMFKPGDQAGIRRELGLPVQDPVVGLFASFKPQKNHPLFFAAATRVLETIPNARFLLVGDQLHRGMGGSDAYKAQVDALVDTLGIRSRCLFLGNRDDVSRLYAACDVTVVSSLFEGTPNVALESMACGVPVIATDVSDNALVIPDGVTGFIVPSGSEERLAARVAQILIDPELRHRMSRNAREWTEREYSPSSLCY
jgi:glycosyltransferase involved in cell wall biosynthesis